MRPSDNTAPTLPAERSGSEELARAFEHFVESSRVLERRYDDLQSRVADLNLELEEKNRLLEENLKEKQSVQNYLARILESLTTGVIVADKTGGIRVHNEAAAALTGQDPRWLSHVTARELFAGWTGDGVLAERIAESESADDPLLVVPDGQAGGAARSVEVSTIGFSDVDGRDAGTIYLLRDVTRQLAMQAETERTERLTAMGEMAVSIVHEVRNPLGSIELYASLLKNDLADHPEQYRLAENISGGVRNLDHIVSNLLSFTRNRQPVPGPVRIADLIDESVRYLDPLLRQHKVTMAVDAGGASDPIRVDGVLIKQVLINLFLNGVQAMEGQGGRLDVTASDQGPHVAVRVADGGCGMDEDVRRRVFNPFFTTKDRGTGLGLALVHNIVTAHRGHITVGSTPGVGTAFTVLLPKE